MKTRFSEEQIINVLKEQDAGLLVREIIRRHGIAEQTLSLEVEVRRHGGFGREAAARAFVGE